MTKLRQIWQRITSTRYVRALEAEVSRQGAEIDRLRAENRALLNSILGIAGVSPITISVEELAAAAHHSSTPSSEGVSSVGARHAVPGEDSCRDAAHPAIATAGATQRPARQTPRARQIAAPLRRRSWHQINRMLEFESARKPVTRDS
ncbi:MAG: hypothetical protein ABSG27_08610 [Candidatus Acidiferrales bacterium]|jgi:hypothetical protein